MMMIARKTEIDPYAKLREVFPKSQTSITSLQQLVEADRGEPLRVWAELESFRHANILFFRCEYSRSGDLIKISMQAEID